MRRVGYVPQPGGTIPACAGQGAAVRGELQPVHPVGVPGQWPAEWDGVRGVGEAPQPDGVVGGPGGEGAPVR